MLNTNALVIKIKERATQIIAIHSLIWASAHIWICFCAHIRQPKVGAS